MVYSSVDESRGCFFVLVSSVEAGRLLKKLSIVCAMTYDLPMFVLLWTSCTDLQIPGVLEDFQNTRSTLAL